MGKILCATRGGEASYRTQDKAIALAKKQGDSLFFIYVVDIHFLDKTAAPILVDAENEVTKMGKFLLVMAQERASGQGVEAEIVLRHGDLLEELVGAANELEASLILLGRPADAESVFQMAGLEQFAAKVETQTGVETRIV